MRRYLVGMGREIMASEFKQRCLALLELVRETGATYTVTKRGKPIAKLVPIEEPDSEPTLGSVTILVDDDQELFSTGEAWDAEGPE